MMNRPYSNRLSRRRIAVNPRIDPSVSRPRLDFADIKAAAQDRWPSILARFGLPTEALRNHHGPCPGCGGVDRFRFDDQDGHGSFICSNGGGDPVAGDGFHLLEHVHDWTPQQVWRRLPKRSVWLSTVRRHCDPHRSASTHPHRQGSRSRRTSAAKNQTERRLGRIVSVGSSTGRTCSTLSDRAWPCGHRA